MQKAVGVRGRARLMSTIARSQRSALRAVSNSEDGRACWYHGARVASGYSVGWCGSTRYARPRRNEELRRFLEERVADWPGEVTEPSGCDGRLTGNLFESPASFLGF
jgi:hypothetical protein